MVLVVASGSEVAAESPVEEAVTSVGGGSLAPTTVNITATRLIRTPTAAMRLPNVAVGSGGELGAKESGGLLRLQPQRRNKPNTMKAKPT